MRARVVSAAQARARIAPTGFCLCGIAEDGPPSPSLTSPTSVCARSSRSSAIFAVTAEAISSAAPSSAIRTRFACHGSVGSRRSSSAA